MLSQFTRGSKFKINTVSCIAGSTITDEHLRVAEEKFEESKQLTETAMFNLLENDVGLIDWLVN